VKPTIVIRPAADADIDGQAAYIARNSPATALRFYTAAEATFAMLAQNPFLGSSACILHPQAADLRLWKIKGFKNHVILYRPTDTGIEVVRVLHAARDLQQIIEEEIS
jgi:toxin ParE1/3/4